MVILLVAVFFGLGIFVGYHSQSEINKIVGISNKETPPTINADFAPFWKAWNVIDHNPGADKITAQERVYGAIAGLVGSLNDPYSVFFNPEETKSFEEEISGSFSGIGAEVGTKDKILTIIAPLKDSPADKAGLKAGDKILKIDKKVTTDLTIEEAIKLLRGEKGTTVVLTIFRKGESKSREISVIRDIINVPTLDTFLRKDGVFVITLYSFTADSARLFRNALKEFANSGGDKLVLDLRGNPGGYLDSAVDMASWFLPSGKVVVTEDYGTNGKPTVHRSKGYDVFQNNLKMVILIDGGSASASEILSGALHDNSVAKLVGEQSYGKGSVQEVVDVTSNTILKITIAKWLTPNGLSISEKGLTPDYLVPITDQDIAAKRDSQMEKAVEVLNNWSQ